jgi:small subunit ribosomal protein S4
MSDTKCKTCRRAGQKLFLKGEKCYTPKCVIIRKPYPPGKSKLIQKSRSISEYGFQLNEKQKLKSLYGLSERQLKNYIQKAAKKKGAEIQKTLIRYLESRIDNIIFRLGFATSRSLARQIINHGHICLTKKGGNHKKKINIPSYQLKKGDTVSIKPTSLSKKIFADLDLKLKKHNPPAWLKLDKPQKKGTLIKEINPQDVPLEINLSTIIEYYLR